MSAVDRGARVDADIAAPLREAAPGLDDLHRARLASAIEGALDREDEAREAKRRRALAPRRWRWWMAAAAAGVSALVPLLALRPFGRHAPVPQSPVAITPVPASPGAPPLLRLYEEAGRGAADAPPSTSLVALRGERARASIGRRVRLTLVGPGRVSVLSAAQDGDILLALDSGRLLVDYDGHGGGTLRVRSPGTLTTVVGTLFAVEVTGSGSRVAVARGRVRTEAASGGRAEVPAGSSWTSDDGRPAPIPGELAAALAEHAIAWTTSPVEPERAAPAAHAEPARRPAARPSPRADLDALYAEAEAAMRARSLAEARRALETIAARDPRGTLGETALLDLARLALADGDRAEARRALALLPHPLRDPALAETAQHLRCRALDPGRGAASFAKSGGDACEGPPATSPR